MKIAFLNKYQNKVNRGAETFVAELSKRLSKNHRVDVISDINYFKLLLGKYDLIIPTNGRLQVVLVRIITWLRGTKMIVSGQSGPGFDDRMNLFAFPDAFVALTNFQKSWAEKVNPCVRIEVIPNGVDLGKFKSAKPKNNGKNHKTVLSVGAFTKDKRHNLTIDAVAKLKDTKLIIVGSSGGLKKDIIKLGLSKLGEDRFEAKTVKHDEMPQIYKKANMLAFPTVPWESFGIVLVEAMATNLPVVATNDPIRAEIVGDAGILVDPTDTDAYAQVLDVALSSNWGYRPRRQAEKFDWDIIAKKYEELLEQL